MKIKTPTIFITWLSKYILNDTCLNNNRGDDNYPDMQCPNCSTQMLKMQKYEVNIDYCSSCKGVWLDRGETGARSMTRQNRQNPKQLRRSTL